MKKPLLMIYYTIIIRIHLHFLEAMSLSGMTNYAKLICEKRLLFIILKQYMKCTFPKCTEDKKWVLLTYSEVTPKPRSCTEDRTNISRFIIRKEQENMPLKLMYITNNPDIGIYRRTSRRRPHICRYGIHRQDCTAGES